MQDARVAVAALVLACLSGCGSPDVTLQVTPATSAYTDALRIRASGLDDGSSVALRMRTKDADGHTWTGTVHVDASSGGTVSTTAARLVSAVHPTTGAKEQYFAPPKKWTETVSVLDGSDVVASRTVRRLVPETDGLVTGRALRPARGGLYGELYEPAHVTGRQSAVVVWGGSEGGLASTGTAAAIAAQGHPALALAYFHAPGLPRDLEEVPLEYFAHAVRRLARAPHVDPKRVFVFGVSRGSESAILTAIDFPGLVHGVVAGVPNAVAGSGLPDRSRGAWSLHGRPVPYSQAPPDAPDNPAAKLAVQRFPGQVLLVCGGDDGIWDSCGYAQALHDRDPSRVTVLSYATAGHNVGSMTPGDPYTGTGGRTAAGATVSYGGEPGDTALAKFDAWPHLLAFLDE